MRNRTSKIWLLEKEKFAELVKNSKTLTEILKYFNIPSCTGGNFKTLKKRIKEENIDITHIMEYFRRKEHIVAKSIPLDTILVENSSYKGSIKNRLLKEKRLEYKCQICGNTGEWNNIRLALHLDHINGIHSDNRLINLRFLCPNCHTQTETYGSKRLKQIHLCEICGKSISKNSCLCIICSNRKNNEKNKKFQVTKEKLERLINEIPMTKIGKMFGVTATSIKARAKKFGIVIPNRRGYWSKVKYGKI